MSKKRAILSALGIALCLILVFGISFAKPLSAEWKKTSVGWSAELIAPFEAEYCFCPAYKQGCSDYNKIIRKGGFWRSQSYYIQLVGPKSPHGATNAFGQTYKTQVPIYGARLCTSKERGEIVELKMIDREKSFWLEIW